MPSGDSISLVVPCYDVARYLPDFFASLEQQGAALDEVEIVFVDDGSRDETGTLIAGWIAEGHPNSVLVTKRNGGLASARNAGLEVAAGKWVSFPDPDDQLGPDYLRTMLDYAASEPARSVHLLVANLLMLDDATGRVRNKHPLRGKFAEGQRVIDLERHPNWIHLQAASAFYRRSVIDELGLLFDHRIRPNFEDASFTTLYLAHFARPRMAVFPQAEYRYRQRSDGSSLVQSSWTKPEKYTDLLEYGHLALLRTLHEQLGRVPIWAQNLVLYDLAFYFRTDVRPNSPTGGLSEATIARFHELLGQVLAYIDVSSIEAFQIVRVSEEMRAAMIIGAKGGRPHPDAVHIDEIDRGRRLVRLSYYFAGELPDERYRARGYLVEPVFGKIRAVRFLGRTMIRQRIVWLPGNGTLAMEMDGRRVQIRIGPEESPAYSASPYALWSGLTGERPPVDLYRNASVRRRTPRARFGRWRRDTKARLLRRFPVRTPAQVRRKLATASIKAYARGPLPRVQYRNAWLLMDRDDQAQDNAERLYRWLRDNQPGVNAWFVLRRDSSDWARLHADGFRLLEYGSPQHTYALLNCRHLISSQIDHYVVQPLSPSRFGEPGWHYTFLQHGVTKDDLSIWINPKPIDLMVTATPDEHHSIVGDDSSYVYTEHEVQMTGFPRHDRLLALARATPPGQRVRILVTPTWRRGLLLDSLHGGNARSLRDDFWDTPYATQWRKVVESERLNKAAAEYGYEVDFVPHPNMQDYLIDSPLPDHISVHRFEDVDVQQMIASADLLVTDYSSLAFEMAYVERPVVYFQFDREEFFSGAHAYRKGTWSYDDDGFGPVTVDAEETIDAMIAVMARGGVVEDVYAERMARTFPLRDGLCSQRTYEAIRALERPLTYDDLYRRRESPDELAGVPVD